jgi:hypothetical protein
MRSLALAAAMTIAVIPAGAQTIYPIDRADILAGARFDLKVEFPDRADPAKVKVTVNGTDHAAVFGKPASFIEREDGKDQSALLLRDVSLAKPGTYRVQASDGIKTREVTWTVFDTPPRKARNVILFIGDGMSRGLPTLQQAQPPASFSPATHPDHLALRGLGARHGGTLQDRSGRHDALAGGGRQVHQVDRSTTDQEAGQANGRPVRQRHRGALRHPAQHHHGQRHQLRQRRSGVILLSLRHPA